MWQTAPNNGWSGWESLGGWIDDLSVAQNNDGRMEVFARGADQSLWHKWQTTPNSGWSGWESLGGWVDMISVGHNADGRLEVFARGADRRCGTSGRRHPAAAGPAGSPWAAGSTG